MSGEGDPVVILHPFHKDAFSSHTFVAQLSQQFRVYSVTLPGMNGICPDSPTNIEQYVEFFESFARVKYLDSFILIGISVAGSVSLHYAINHSKTVKKLILISHSGLRSFYLCPKFWPLKSLYISSLARKLSNKNRFHRFFSHLLYTSKFQLGYYLPAEAFQKNGAWPRQAARSIFILSQKFSKLTRNLHRIDKPVLLLGAANDRLVPPSSIRLMEGELQSVHVQFIDRAGHLSLLENPEEYFVKIEQFI
jgi:pimeloyl-ACP methyl ester carboxylesterase